MRRALGLASVLAVGAASVAAAQIARPRSTEYLFASAVEGARALWVNPAGLATVLEASVMGELVVERPDTGNTRLGAWSVGFNTRGVALGYQRDRLPGGSVAAWRVGLGAHIPRGALGGAASLYRGDGSDAGFDLGFRYVLLPSLEAGAVVRDIGRPVVAGSARPVSGTVGLGWLAVPHVLALAAEVQAAERLGASGLDVGYRGGIHAASGGTFPVGAILSAELGTDFAVRRWAVGLSLGGADRVIGVASGIREAGALEVDRMSVTGVASRRPPDQRP